MRHRTGIIRAHSERPDLAASCMSSPISPIDSRSALIDTLRLQLNTDIGGTDDAIYLIIGDLGSDSGQGLDFINGMTFLERFYTTFDSDASTFGIANTPFTDATSN